MKLDFKNIDEVFKDGLEDYSEQPSGNVWKNISGKMFWYDLFHLRFGNIPKIWLGSIAVIALISVFVGGWLLIPDSEPSFISDSSGLSISTETSYNTESETPENKEIETADDIRNTGIVDDKASISSTGSGTAGMPKLKKENDTQQEILNQNTSSVELISVATGLKLDDNPANEHPDEATSGIVKTESSTPDADGSVILAGSTGSTVVNSNTQPGTGLSTKKNSADTGSNEPNPSQKPDLQSVEINHLHSSGNLSQVESVNTGLDSFIGINKSLGNMQKIEHVGSISFTTAEPVNYSRKPSARNFATPPAFLNKGYVPYFSISAYYAPELTEYHRVASESREKSWLTGLSVSYNTEKYTFQAGLEYSRFDDLGDYLVNINSYDSIGFYEGISGFDIDPENPDELIYHTHTVEVWDTVQHHSHQQTTNNYSYLQIPVMFGYKAMETGTFSAHIKAGPSISFLLNRIEPTLNYQSGAGTRITSVDNFTASRITTNVQVLVSVALRMQITERVGILVEPIYRQYLNTVYDVDDQSLKNPYGIGARGGIFINF